MKLPMQPVYSDHLGTVRFVPNRIVDDLLTFASERGHDMNKIACKDYTQEERMQFAQLIGYSVSGYSDLSDVSDESYEESWDAVGQLLKGD